MFDFNFSGFINVTNEIVNLKCRIPKMWKNNIMTFLVIIIEITILHKVRILTNSRLF